MRVFKCSRGTSLLETALILPVMLFLALIIVQVGIFVTTQLVISEAARESARQYVTYAREGGGYLSDEEALWKSKSRAQDIMSSVSYTSSFDAGEDYGIDVRHDEVTVTIRCECPLLVPGMGGLVGSGRYDDTVLLSGSATFHRLVPEKKE